jgi:hypothetical protein
MDKTDEILALNKLWERIKSARGNRQAMELYNQLCDRLPKRLPENADVELPESGSALIPAEKLCEIFPESYWMIDEGWEVFVTQDGRLVWWCPLCVCPVCGEEAELVAENVAPLSNWEAMVTSILRCRACGHEWLYEWRM